MFAAKQTIVSISRFIASSSLETNLQPKAAYRAVIYNCSCPHLNKPKNRWIGFQLQLAVHNPAPQ